MESPTQHWDNVLANTGVEEGGTYGHTVYEQALGWFGDVRGRKLLDIGCGNGAATLFFARHGARVTAIDTSAIAVNGLAYYCRERGIENVNAYQRSAFEIGDFGEFDFVFGSLILHHLEPFDAFVDVLAETVPHGRGFFYENNANNPLLMWMRRNVVGRFGVPKFGDAEESPLATNEVEALRRRFHVEVTYPHLILFSLIGKYLIRRDRATRWLTALDNAAYRVPALRRFGYRQCISLSHD